MHTPTKTLLILITALCALASTGCPANFSEPTTQVQGVYDAETRYDMKTLAGTLSAVEPWQQPNKAIRTAIVNTFKANYGAEIANLVSEYYGTWIADEIESYLKELAPQWLLSLPGTLSTVDAQLDMVDVQTSLLLSQDTTNGDYKVTQTWNGITVFRDPACRKNGGLACDQITISIKDLLDAEYPIDLVNSTYTVSESNSALTMQSNEIRFNYGRLALYLMTNLALPNEPGAGLRLRDVVLAAINCRGLAGRLAGEDKVLGWNIAGFEVGLSLNDLVGSCEDGIFAMTNNFVDQFNVPLNMNLGGTLNMIDKDYDGKIDQLVTDNLDGTLKANLFTGQSKEGPVTGQMTSWRVGDIGDDNLIDDSDNETIDDGEVLFNNKSE